MICMIGKARKRIRFLTFTILILSMLGLNSSPVRASYQSVSDYFSYTASDPDHNLWGGCGPGYEFLHCSLSDPPLQQGNNPFGLTHDLSVSNGYLHSTNNACIAIGLASTSGDYCGADAAMFSRSGVTYTKGVGMTLSVTDRFSPNIFNFDPTTICAAFSLLNPLGGDNDREFHLLMMYDSANWSPTNGGGALAILYVMAYCSVNIACFLLICWPVADWHFYGRISYDDANGARQSFVWLTGSQYQEIATYNDWLDLTITTSGDGAQTRFNLYNERTGQTFAKTVATKLGSYSTTVSMGAIFNHDETSLTDYMLLQASTPSSGGGGSIGYGSLISMADGSTKPVQNLLVGDSMLAYDPTAQQWGVSTILSVTAVHTSNQLIIQTASGAPPFRVDANSYQTLWTQTPDGQATWLPVTSLQVGDKLLTPTGWTSITGIQFAPAGDHIMFDITATMPYFANGYLDPIFKV